MSSWPWAQLIRATMVHTARLCQPCSVRSGSLLQCQGAKFVPSGRTMCLLTIARVTQGTAAAHTIAAGMQKRCNAISNDANPCWESVIHLWKSKTFKTVFENYFFSRLVHFIAISSSCRVSGRHENGALNCLFTYIMPMAQFRNIIWTSFYCQLQTTEESPIICGPM